MPKQQLNKYDKKHLANLKAYERQIDRIFQSAVREAAKISGIVSDFNPDKQFSFKDYPATSKRVEKLLIVLKNDIESVVLKGIDHEWTLSNNKNNELSNRVFGDNVGKLTEQQYRRYYRNNEEARDAFKTRQEEGLSLSDRVWEYTNIFKSEIEQGIDLGLRDGISADELSRDLRSYLKNPDKLFRRVRDIHGNLVLSQAAQAFHPGRGVYRSSYKNARRLAATEINMAYRTADYLRWQQLDFVVGIKICLSNNHTLNGQPFNDICDELAGDYPKDFKFTGWHPQCRCHAVSILKTEEELMEENKAILACKEPTTYSKNAVQDVPEKFKEWIERNEERINRSKSAPYFLQNNTKYTGVHTQRMAGVGALNGTKLGRSATKEAFKEYEDVKPITLTNEQLTQISEIAKDMGLKNYKPMTFFEANEGQANINFGKSDIYANNCQCCVAIHEARLRGLNLTAVGYSDNKQSITYKLGENFQEIWVNPKTGKTPQVTSLKADTDEILFDKLNKSMSAKGRYHVGINFSDNTGHVITAERLESGKILFYDPQSGEFLNIKEYNNLESFEVLKVDKLLFNKDMLRAISNII